VDTTVEKKDESLVDAGKRRAERQTAASFNASILVAGGIITG